MALYVSAGQRRRKVVVAVVVALVLGLVGGFAIGRLSTPSLADQAAEVRRDARQLTARLDALPLEYEQVVQGREQSAAGGGVSDALRGIDADSRTLAGRAVWLSAEQTGSIAAALALVQAGVDGKVPPSEFAARVDQARTTLRGVYGLT